MSRPKTPELDRMLAVKEKSQTIGEFIEWLTNSSLMICEYGANTCPFCDDEIKALLPVRSTIEQLLADFFKIDLGKCEQERQQILADLRADGR